MQMTRTIGLRLSAFDALKASGALDEVMAKIDTGQLQITGQGGFLQEMVKAVLERGLQTELTEHLGYDKGDLAGRLLPNARNGFSSKTVSSEVGDVPLAIPATATARSFQPWSRVVRAGSVGSMT